MVNAKRRRCFDVREAYPRELVRAGFFLRVLLHSGTARVHTHFKIRERAGGLFGSLSGLLYWSAPIAKQCGAGMLNNESPVSTGAGYGAS